MDRSSFTSRPGGLSTGRMQYCDDCKTVREGPYPTSCPLCSLKSRLDKLESEGDESAAVGKVEDQVKDILDNRARILEDFAKAYLAETGLKVNEVRMCRRMEPDGETIWFEPFKDVCQNTPRADFNWEAEVKRVLNRVEEMTPSKNRSDPFEMGYQSCGNWVQTLLGNLLERSKRVK